MRNVVPYSNRGCTDRQHSCENSQQSHEQDEGFLEHESVLLSAIESI